ncbi:MAG: hypothetical protein DRP00_03050 [Candidatus Aenigmatarchaeota archaeon]|nr:MAG: hypothetical protein DRP00_03050 [Candidatus Aenigmarchaeota archaeon]
MVVSILIQGALLIIFLAILSFSSDLTVRNAEKIARITRLGEMMFGFLLLAVATSLPEAVVTFSAVSEDAIGISIGNLLGSNIVNLSLILGLIALFKPVVIVKKSLKNISTILFLTSAIPVLLLNVSFPSRLVGFFLIITFFYFSYYLTKRRVSFLKKEFIWKASFTRFLLLFCFGLGLVIISSRIVVVLASNLATQLEIPESFIGATLIALGTSLPELSLSFSALRRKKISLLVGNLIGSNFANLSLLLGLLLLLTGFSITSFGVFSTLVINLLILNIVLWIFFGREKLERFEGLALILLYVFFLASMLGIGITI